MTCNSKRTDWLNLAREVLDIEIQGLAAVKEQLGESFVEALTALAECEGRVVITGVGKSGLVGRKIAATLSSTGTPSFFLHPVEGAHGDMGMIRKEDVVIAMSNSGGTDEVNTIIPVLRSLGATVIAMTSNTASAMAQLSDIAIKVSVPREACALGLAPTSSTTAQLAVGDALAVCLMEWKSFGKDDFKKYHPGGSLGQRLAICVDQLMHTEDLPTVREHISLTAALKILNGGGLGLVAIVDAANLLKGVFSDGDVRRLVCDDLLDGNQTISEVMTASPRRAVTGDSSAHVLDVMERNEITVLPVVSEDGTLAGMVHMHDLLGKGELRFSNGHNGEAG
ncbi:carbohydrate isomerase KpsF/GutQ family protein [Pseudodesulfovibrio nedwellii]|uniref:Carbohydrate isomerase KpsF/GutQ family protein n=1 Tax=Pseudodesulfovibrio nedwellii TaxID=2973072 RepID=A0ABM8AZ43_9BACT|nr:MULTISPECIES: KpsF/GutQ family sugar-phosphate isomerase [Pseudodesulfovibrio]BDQ36743.1 carbohydrate isomerase KpsF/GutQ family protein [Pseudodesulfovibrio nedwellii]